MKGTLFIFFLALFTMASAQNNCHSGRYYSEVFTSTTSTSGIKFGESDPFGLLSNQDLYLDIVEPVGDTLSKRPLILHQFGGGFLIGWRTEPVIPQMAEMYAKRGFVFATIDYRLGFNPLDGQSAERAVYRASQDLRASLRFLVDNADLYGIDTSAIFITGTSAGCLAAFVSTFMNESDRVDIPSTFGITFEPADLGCGNCSGNNNFNNQEVKVHGIINNWGAMLDTSYIDLAVDPADNVPVISFHGTNDIIVPYVSGQPFSLPIFPSVQGSFLIHQRLENQGVKNRLFPLQGLGHEPQLLQLQTWVTDTIIREGSKFLYEIMYGDSIEILGDATVCLNDTFTYSLPLHAGSSYCWNVTGGSIIQQNMSQITVLWNALGTHLITANELDKREISKEAQFHVEVALPPLPLIDFTSNDGLFVFSSLSVANDYSWNFGDGNQGTGSLVNHQYMDTGFFLLNFWIEDDYCNKEKDTLIESTLCPNAQLDIIQDDS
ncbi:MAG: acetyl esterase/lipase, partial [Chitinophagales bacterium]